MQISKKGVYKIKTTSEIEHLEIFTYNNSSFSKKSCEQNVGKKFEFSFEVLFLEKFHLNLIL